MKLTFAFLILVLITGMSYAVFHEIENSNFMSGERGAQSSHTSDSPFLEVSVNSTSISPGEPFLLHVTLFNPSATNVPVKVNQSQILGAQPCNNYIPIGVIMYKGIFTPQNVSNATPLYVYPRIVFCPIEFPVINETLLPQSDILNVTYEGIHGVEYKFVSSSVSVKISGYYGGPLGDKLVPLSPGEYTIEISSTLTPPSFIYITVS
ncbi:hypothetical protein [Sulfuracidifex tepidarius]|uniref:Uncharacterized protein n=1 Tax=Sulfuracidifex tepidarius TaxID=1294262 RepID=A0A510DXQ7_9CREN|nr:hypothetical protein [Sulfuracidifex tepidarius]BBG24994.1 hypothetical protein IC006_2328 [Sulfuracidifex tepidarius]BBG27779.1 hypothetical protein IC007_2333 [Sulfuracidifex tepidarius]